MTGFGAPTLVKKLIVKNTIRGKIVLEFNDLTFLFNIWPYSERNFDEWLEFIELEIRVNPV